MASAGQAAVVNLDFAAAGNYSATGVSTVVTVSTSTTVLTSQTFNTATFDISYTLGVTGGTNPFVQSNGSIYGVGSDTDNVNHYLTMEGDGNEGISFTDLKIVNFVANSSGLTIADITDLKFTQFSVNNAGNGSDDINIGYTGFTNTDNVNLRSGDLDQTIDLEGLANYPGAPTGLYLIGSNNNSNNRWGVTGVEVAYTIPEPSSAAILLGGLGMLALRRRRNR